MSESQRYLITGAQGFVGRYVVAELLSREPHCLVMGTGRSARSDRSFTHSITFGDRRFPAPLPAVCRTPSDEVRYEYRQSDLLAPESLVPLIREFTPTTVIHLASGLRGDEAVHLFRTNVEGTVNLLREISRAGDTPPRVICGSTGGVYGAADETGDALSEEDMCRPIDMYSVSKLAAEYAARVVCKQFRIPVLFVRLFNLVGPGQDERHVCGRFASALVAIKHGLTEKRIRVGALDTTRDFIDVRDVARSVRTLSKTGVPGEAYNVASGVETRIETILSLLLELASLTEKVDIETSLSIAAGVQRHVASVVRLRKTGFEPKLSLRRSLADLLDYYESDVLTASENPDKVRGDP